MSSSLSRNDYTDKDTKPKQELNGLHVSQQKQEPNQMIETFEDTQASDEGDAEEDDPLGIGIDSTTLYIVVSCCVCMCLLSIIGSLFMFMGDSNDSNDTQTPGFGVNNTDDGGSCGSNRYVIELNYGSGVNPFNNFSIPPFIPKPPQYFGSSRN